MFRAIGWAFGIDVEKVRRAVPEVGSDSVRKHCKQIVSIGP
jgi:hypothetical protein